MFYVCSRANNGNYGVIDTEDGVVTQCTYDEVEDFVEKQNIEILGYNDKKITVLPIKTFIRNSDDNSMLLNLAYRKRKYEIRVQKTQLGYDIYFDDEFGVSFDILDKGIEFNIEENTSCYESKHITLCMGSKGSSYDIKPKIDIFVMHKNKKYQGGLYLRLTYSNEYDVNTSGIDETFVAIDKLYYLNEYC